MLAKGYLNGIGRQNRQHFGRKLLRKVIQKKLEPVKNWAAEVLVWKGLMSLAGLLDIIVITKAKSSVGLVFNAKISIFWSWFFDPNNGSITGGIFNNY